MSIGRVLKCRQSVQTPGRTSFHKADSELREDLGREHEPQRDIDHHADGERIERPRANRNELARILVVSPMLRKAKVKVQVRSACSGATSPGSTSLL
jgi:hypothetical protein